MANYGVIAPIVKDIQDQYSYVGSLSKHGYVRSPKAILKLTPYREVGGSYRTGLDPEANYLNNLPEEEKKIEVKRIKEIKARLEKHFNVKLDSKSDFYNFKSNSDFKVAPINLSNSEVKFDLSDPLAELNYMWLKVHPFIAASKDKAAKSPYGSLVQYYVKDNELEVKIEYKKRKQENEALIEFDNLTPSKKKQVARLMGIPVTEYSTEEQVYNQMDTLLKQGTFKTGINEKRSTLTVFKSIINLSDYLLKVKDNVEQALNFSIIYVKKGSPNIYEGENVIADNKEELIQRLSDTKHQDELLALEEKLKVKKIIKG